MRGLNELTLMGNLAKTPELRYTEKQNPYVFIVIAVNYPRKKEDGTYEESVNFIPCTAWGKQAEVIAKHFHKGSQILVKGRVKENRREVEKDGVKQTEYKLSISLSRFYFLGRKEGEEVPADAGNSSDIPESYEIDSGDYGEDYFPEAEADIPF